MRRLFEELFLICSLSFVVGIQPYFPSEIVFTTNNGQTLYAIDQTNQRAFINTTTSSDSYLGYVFEHFPYAPVDTPQSKYYVQLTNESSSNSCSYGTYWKYGGDKVNYFPKHWDQTTSFEIKNFLDIDYNMIHSDNQSILEDYWYSDEICQLSFEESHPCFQIYFKKNTEIPLQSTEAIIIGGRQVFRTSKYEILSIGKPDEKYFNRIPTDWYTKCSDVMLKVHYHYDTPIIKLHEKKIVGVSLFTPPHRINGNDTMTIQWNVTQGCTDCLTWTPKQLSFHGQNFNQIQNLTFFRRIQSTSISLSPIFHGGAFDDVSTETNRLDFQ